MFPIQFPPSTLSKLKNFKIKQMLSWWLHYSRSYFFIYEYPTQVRRVWKKSCKSWQIGFVREGAFEVRQMQFSGYNSDSRTPNSNQFFSYFACWEPLSWKIYGSWVHWSLPFVKEVCICIGLMVNINRWNGLSRRDILANSSFSRKATHSLNNPLEEGLGLWLEKSKLFW